MKKKLLHIVLLTVPLVTLGDHEIQAQGVGGPGGILCTSSVVPAVATTATIVVTGVAGQRVNVCGWVASSSATANSTLQFSYSAISSACTASTTTLTPAIDVINNNRADFYASFAIISTPIGQSLCAVPSSTSVKYMVFYGLN